MKIDRKEVLRYMRAGDDQRFFPLIDEVSQYLLKNFVPAKSIGYFDIEHTQNGVILSGTGVEFKGNLIKRRLTGATKIALVAATLGIRTENYMKTLAGDMLKSVIADAAMTAMLESFLDDLEEEIKEEHNGNTVSARFSAGYGDFDISSQKDIIGLLNAEKLLGVYIKESFMLYPNKSVTAVIGIGGGGESSSKCGDCSQKSCCGYKTEEAL